jgi:hypothetical protein
MIVFPSLLLREKKSFKIKNNKLKMNPYVSKMMP